MPIALDAGRQYRLSAQKEFAFGDLTDNTYMAAIEVPINAIVTDVRLIITTLFNSATTDQFSIGHQPKDASAVSNYYAALSADVTAVPTQILGVPTGLKYTNGGTVGLLWDGTGAAPTAGAGILLVEYTIDGRAHEVNP